MKRALSLLLCLAFAFALVSCGDSDASLVFEPLDDDDGGIALNLLPIDPVGSFSGDVDDPVISSENFRVGASVFDALLNYVIIRQLSPGDGDFDEYDAYFESGALDRLGSIQGQKLPDKDAYWLGYATSQTVVIVCEALHYFEYSEYSGIPVYSRINERKVNRELQRIKDGEYGGTLEELFGDSSEEDVYLALTLKTIYDDPSEIAFRLDYGEFPRAECIVSQTLSPSVFPGIELAAKFFQQK